MTRKEIHIAIDATLSELLKLISTFDQKQFNIAPSKDSWSAGEIAQHLVLSISGFVELMNGPTQATKRKPDEHVEKIKSDFLNFSIKFKSPDSVVPEKKDYNKDDLIQTLKGLKIALEDIIENSDLDQTCTAFELPGGMGYLTRQEGLAFVLYHTQRHIHQLKNTYRTITSAMEAKQGISKAN